MAPFLDLARLSFEIWKAKRHLLDVRLALFFGPLAHAPSDVGLDQGNHCPYCSYLQPKHTLATLSDNRNKTL